MFMFLLIRLNLDVAPGSTVALVSLAFHNLPRFRVSSKSLPEYYSVSTSFWQSALFWMLMMTTFCPGRTLRLWQVYLYPACAEALRPGLRRGLFNKTRFRLKRSSGGSWWKQPEESERRLVEGQYWDCWARTRLKILTSKVKRHIWLNFYISFLRCTKQFQCCSTAVSAKTSATRRRTPQRRK